MDSRKCVFSILKFITEDGMDLEQAIEKSGFSDYPQNDRALIRNMVMLCLRYRKPLTISYNKFLKKKLNHKQNDISLVMLIGSAQILLMKIADHAAVHSSVELAKILKFPYAPSLVNAVLHKIIDNKDDLQQKILKEKNNILPGWLAKRWKNIYRNQTVEYISEVILKEPSLDISCKSSEDSPVFAQKLSAFSLKNGSLRLKENPGDIRRLEGYEDGKWWVQDFAASLPVLLAGDILGKNVLDCCAAPGGKSMQMLSKGASVTAIDRSGKRIVRLRENLSRVNLAADILNMDLIKYSPGAIYDIILLDAPCSATGTLRRHPDLMWNKSEKDIKAMSEIQAIMLSHVKDLLKPSGIIIYTTCSLEPEEGEEQINKFLNANNDMRIMPVTKKEATSIGINKRWINKKGFLRTLPHFTPEITDSECENRNMDIQGMDGFFAARLVKIS